MPDKNKLKQRARERKKKRIGKKLQGTPERPRLAVYRSLKNVYAFLIDDTANRTITSVSSLSKQLQNTLAQTKNKCEVAKLVGKALAQKAREMNIEQVVFDRSGYLYHGRVKALAEGAREGGLKF